MNGVGFCKAGIEDVRKYPRYQEQPRSLSFAWQLTNEPIDIYNVHIQVTKGTLSCGPGTYFVLQVKNQKNNQFLSYQGDPSQNQG